MMRPQRILVGFGNAVAAPEATWSLRDAGFDVIAFRRRGDSAAHHRRGATRVFTIHPPEEDAARATRELVALAQQVGAAALLPLDDAAVWLCDAAADQLTSGCVAGPTGPQALLALDKHRQVCAAADAGFAVPATSICLTPGQLDTSAPLPRVARTVWAVDPGGGRLRRGTVTRLHGPGDVERLKEHWPGPQLVQPLLQGTGEGLFGLATDTGVVAWSAHRRLRTVDPLGSGSSACAAQPPDPALMACGERLVAATGWRGLFMIELLRTEDGTPYFVEFNGRCWGSLALSRGQGLEYAAWTVARALDVLGPLPRVHPTTEGLVYRHLGRELLHLARVFRGPAPGVVGWPSRRAALHDVLRVAPGERLYNWRASEPLVLVGDTVDTLVGAVQRAAAR